MSGKVYLTPRGPLHHRIHRACRCICRISPTIRVICSADRPMRPARPRHRSIGGSIRPTGRFTKPPHNAGARISVLQLEAHGEEWSERNPIGPTVQAPVDRRPISAEEAATSADLYQRTARGFPRVVTRVQSAPRKGEASDQPGAAIPRATATTSTSNRVEIMRSRGTLL